MGMSDGTRESLIAVFEAHEALIDRLISENALLRDLCEDMHRECGESMGYDHPLLKELGIEVE